MNEIDKTVTMLHIASPTREEVKKTLDAHDFSGPNGFHEWNQISGDIYSVHDEQDMIGSKLKLIYFSDISLDIVDRMDTPYASKGELRYTCARDLLNNAQKLSSLLDHNSFASYVDEIEYYTGKGNLIQAKYGGPDERIGRLERSLQALNNSSLSTHSEIADACIESGKAMPHRRDHLFNEAITELQLEIQQKPHLYRNFLESAQRMSMYADSNVTDRTKNKIYAIMTHMASMPINVN